MTEAEFEAQIVEMAHTFQWSVAGFRPAQTKHGWRTPVKYDGEGWPDLTLIHRHGHIVFAEIKVGRGQPSQVQQEWGRILEDCAVNISDALDTGLRSVMYRLWYPSDGNDIISILSFGRATEWTI